MSQDGRIIIRGPSILAHGYSALNLRFGRSPSKTEDGVVFGSELGGGGPRHETSDLQEPPVAQGRNSIPGAWIEGKFPATG